MGLPRGISDIIGALPVKMSGSGKRVTAMRMGELVSLKHKTFRAFMAEANHIIALCKWAGDLLLLNGIPEEKMSVIRHGLVRETARRFPGNEPSLRSDSRPLKVAYLGRLHPTKGVDVIVRAIRSLPGSPIELHIYGIAQGAEDNRYLEKLKKIAKADPRIVFEASIPNGRAATALKEYHLLAVPSRWLETGPLVILEACAAGIPVVGSDLGGIAELVTHEVNGLLIKAGSAAAWSAAFKRLCEDKRLLVELQHGICPPRSMETVAKEISDIYQNACL
jgi:glycosyltransferase involved in cell wall biosynthesis